MLAGPASSLPTEPFPWLQPGFPSLSQSLGKALSSCWMLSLVQQQFLLLPILRDPGAAFQLLPGGVLMCNLFPLNWDGLFFKTDTSDLFGNPPEFEAPLGNISSSAHPVAGAQME